MKTRLSIAALLCCSALALTACESDKETEGDQKAEAEKAEAPDKPDKPDKKEGTAADKPPADKPKAAELTEAAAPEEATTVAGGACDEPKKLTGFDTKTVLSAKEGGCFLIDKVLELRGKDKKLFIEPGVTLKFTENAGLSIRQAALVAQGTADEPIVMTGQREMPGFWKGIVVRQSDRPDNRLEHVQIKYAGNDSTFDGVQPAALMFDDYHGKTSFAVHNTTISDSEGHGLYVENNTDLNFAGNTLTGNKEGAARVEPAALGQLDAATTYSGNENDRVVVSGGTIKEHEATWPGLDVPYEVIESITVRDGSFITVQPGATFKFGENQGMSLRKSRLSAVGTKEQPITWTATRQVEGFWKGIVFREADSIDNKLQHVVVSYAGAENTFDGVKPAGVMFDDYHGKSSFVIEQSTFSYSAGYGLYVEEDTELDFAANTLTKNKMGAAYLHPAVVGALDAESTYAGNKEDRVHVSGATVKGVEATWPAIDVPYVVEETIVFRDGSFLTLAAGTTLKFAENQGLSLRDAKLKAEGTADKPILLTGTREAAGFWKGLILRETSSIDNVLAHVTVAYAGATQTFDGVEPAGVMFDNYHGPISFRVSNLTVRDSGGAGLHLEKKVTLKSDDCATVTLPDPPVTEKSQPFEEVCGK